MRANGLLAFCILLSFALLDAGSQRVLAQGDSTEDLRRIVHEGVARSALPAPPQDRSLEKLFLWSSVVNDLACRIEYSRSVGYAGYTVLVRLENRGSKPLRVPMGNPRETEPARLFELHARIGDGAWKRIGWLPRENLDGPGPTIPWDGKIYPRMATRNDASRRDITLAPGESALALLAGSPELPQEKLDITEIKIVVRRSVAPSADAWLGVLESPPFPIRLSAKEFKACSGLLPAPDHLPQWNPHLFVGGNMFGTESEFRKMQISNGPLLDSLDLYETRGLRAALERQMAKEYRFTLKLLLAASAAKAGSEIAALFILRCLSDTDHVVVSSTHDALKDLIYDHKKGVPGWLLALVSMALRDERTITRQTYQGDPMKISELADRDAWLPAALGHANCKEAVPLLLELVERTKGNTSAVYALGDIGDKSVIPPLVKLAQEASRDKDASLTIGVGGRFDILVDTLVQLKASEVLPFLLDHLRYPMAIEHLVHLGDPRALPALQRLVETNGMLLNPEWNQHDWPRQRLATAKVALATINATSRTERLGALLSDPSFTENDRVYVVWRLRDMPDPKAIPFLLKAIKSDADGSVVDHSINVLRVFRHDDSVTGLIDCFDANFDGKSNWKSAHSPEGFRHNIATSLQVLTGEDIGPDKNRWQTWWEGRGKTMDWKSVSEK